MKKNIILARYNEDVSWIFENLDLFENVFIANKGEKIDKVGDPRITVYELQNVGREAHTYLNFICDYYDFIQKNNSDLFIFSQAYPHEHNWSFIENIEQLNESTQFPATLSKVSAIENKFASFGKKDNPVHPNGLPFINFYNHLFFEEKLGITAGEDGFKHLVKYGALWVVPAEHLLFRKREFYQKCVSLVDNHINPIEAYIFERMWEYIFDNKTLDWISHYEQIRKQYTIGKYRGIDFG